MHESMQNAISIAREAKVLTQSLKESLKKHEPWDREIEFQRANLRRQYLQLIFVYPYAKESKDIDHSLWMTTSYFIITAYKQRIAAADAVTHQLGSDTNTTVRHHHHGKPSGIVEHRKLVHRFRQFLAEEEKFWTSFILRMVRVFVLDDARPVLSALGIVVSDSVSSEGPSAISDRRSVFPPEDVTSTPSHVQKEQKLVMLSKALVCLGDIARYREHYNESGGRPRAGKDFHDDARSTTRGRGGRRGAVEQPPRPRNYSKAQECYERARLLVPDVGNACHQLAILASYQQDPFASVLQYYRAICIKHPYDTAASNLDSTLSRNLEAYTGTLAKLDVGSNELSQSPKVRVERFKKSLVALHGLWRLDPEEAETRLPAHDAYIITIFSSLVSERVLPTDIIWKALVLALGALWRFRILRDPNSKRNTKGANAAIEAQIFLHILGLFSTLLRVGTVQLTDVSSTPESSINIAPMNGGEPQSDLAQNITAVFRRTLPALRIGSKWVRFHFGYIGDASSRLGIDTDLPVFSIINEFWDSYSIFSTLLGKIFPIERLPKMTVPLEEDVDVSGFAPLKRAMFDPITNSPNGLEHGQSQVHPNEEQLMRIADLLDDAMTISKFADAPFKFQDDKFVPFSSESNDRGDGRTGSSHSPPESVSAELAPVLSASQNRVKHMKQSEVNEDLGNDGHSEVEDDNATVSTRTEDDPVNLAMQAQLGSDDDDEMEEQIVYPKQNLSSMAVSMSASTSYSTPSVQAEPSSSHKPVTAEDLVNDMMRPRGLSLVDSIHPRAPTTGPQVSPLLFTPGSPNAPTSIWTATTLDSAALSTNNLRFSSYPGGQNRGTPPTSLPFRQDQNGPLPPPIPSRNVFGHQRHPSQPLSSPAQAGMWSKGSSPLQPMHTPSPPLASYVPQPIAAGGRYQASPSSYTRHPPHRNAIGSSQSQLPHSDRIPQNLSLLLFSDGLRWRTDEPHLDTVQSRTLR